MKKILFLMTMLMIATTAVKAQTLAPRSGNAILLQPAGSYIYYGNQVMNKKECAEFLAVSNPEAYKQFQSGLKCTRAGWWTVGTGLAVDLIGSILVAFAPENNSDAMFWSGASCIVAGGLAILASIPTIYIGYVRMNRGIDTFNAAQVSTARAYWSIQGSRNGIGLALNF